MIPAVRVLATLLGYLLALALVAALTLVGVLVLAGPHAGILPGWLEPAVLVLGWLAVLLLPLWVARWIWRRLGGTARNGTPP
jgi:hypothetical protein